MKAVNSGVKYLMRNKPTGRQSIKFYVPADIMKNQKEQPGTTLKEVIDVCIHRLGTSEELAYNNMCMEKKIELLDHLKASAKILKQ